MIEVHLKKDEILYKKNRPYEKLIIFKSGMVQLGKSSHDLYLHGGVCLNPFDFINQGINRKIILVVSENLIFLQISRKLFDEIIGPKIQVFCFLYNISVKSILSSSKRVS